METNLRAYISALHVVIISNKGIESFGEVNNEVQNRDPFMMDEIQGCSRFNKNLKVG